MDDRTLGAVVGGALLVGTSALRIERAAQRSTQANFIRSLERLQHSWMRRLSHIGAAMGAFVGLVLLLYARRRQRASVRSQDTVSPPNELSSARPPDTSSGM